MYAWRREKASLHLSVVTFIERGTLSIFLLHLKLKFCTKNQFLPPSNSPRNYEMSVVTLAWCLEYSSVATFVSFSSPRGARLLWLVSSPLSLSRSLKALSYNHNHHRVKNAQIKREARASIINTRRSISGSDCLTWWQLEDRLNKAIRVSED